MKFLRFGTDLNVVVGVVVVVVVVKSSISSSGDGGGSNNNTSSTPPPPDQTGLISDFLRAHVGLARGSYLCERLRHCLLPAARATFSSRAGIFPKALAARSLPLQCAHESEAASLPYGSQQRAGWPGEPLARLPKRGQTRSGILLVSRRAAPSLCQPSLDHVSRHCSALLLQQRQQLIMSTFGCDGDFYVL